MTVSNTIEGRTVSMVTYDLLSHWIVFRHPSLVFPGNRVDEAMIVNDFRRRNQFPEIESNESTKVAARSEG